MSQRTSGDLVSYFLNILCLISFFIFIVDRPDMRPRKDYDDYTTFVNDTYSESKNKMFKMLSENGSREGSP